MRVTTPIDSVPSTFLPRRQSSVIRAPAIR
jgi:hypothetical protein